MESCHRWVERPRRHRLRFVVKNTGRRQRSPRQARSAPLTLHYVHHHPPLPSQARPSSCVRETYRVVVASTARGIRARSGACIRPARAQQATADGCTPALASLAGRSAPALSTTASTDESPGRRCRATSPLFKSELRNRNAAR